MAITITNHHCDLHCRDNDVSAAADESYPHDGINERDDMMVSMTMVLSASGSPDLNVAVSVGR